MSNLSASKPYPCFLSGFSLSQSICFAGDVPISRNVYVYLTVLETKIV